MSDLGTISNLAGGPYNFIADTVSEIPDSFIIQSGQHVFVKETGGNYYGDSNTIWANLRTSVYSVEDSKVGAENSLFTWQSGLAWRETSQVKVLFLGHSVVYGVGSTVPGARFADKVISGLRTQFPVLGALGPRGSGYVPACVYGGANTLLGIAYVTTIGSAPATAFGTFGYDDNNIAIANGTTIAFNFTGTSISTVVGKFINQTAVMTVSIDGVAGAPQTYTNVTGANTDGEVYNSPDVAYGTHACTIASTGANGIRLGGWHVFGGNRTKGIHGIVAGHGGYTTTNLVTNMATRLQPIMTKAYPPNLVIIMAMINDYYKGVPSVTTAANLQLMINAIIASGVGFHPPSIVILSEWEIGDAGTSIEPWDNYRKAAKTVAAVNNALFIDLSTRIPNPLVDNTLALIDVDLIHPTNRGHDLIAQIVLEAITTGRKVSGIPVASTSTNVITANYTATTSDSLIVTSTSGLSVTLPSPTGISGFSLIIRNGSAGNLTVVGTVEGVVSPVLTTLTTGRYRSDGVLWWNA